MTVTLDAGPRHPVWTVTGWELDKLIAQVRVRLHSCLVHGAPGHAEKPEPADGGFYEVAPHKAGSAGEQNSRQRKIHRTILLNNGGLEILSRHRRCQREFAGKAGYWRVSQCSTPCTR